MLSVSPPPWAWPCSWRVCFPSLHCLGSRLLCQEPSEAGPWVACTSQVYATQVQVLRYSTKGHTWLGLRFVPVPGLSTSGDQVLGECSCPQLEAVAYRLPHSSSSVFWVYNGCTFSVVLCVSSGEMISGCDPPGGCRPSRIPRSLGAMKPACSLV